MARRMVDEDGNLKSFERWAEDVKPIADHQCRRWLRTEYDTAVKRASLAADWQQFEDEKDVLPNLRWVPSTAAVPDAFHQSMWNTVLPVDHPFWSGHHPGDRWGCQCSLEATDDPATDVPEADYKTSPGLDNNPGIDAKLFNETHPYFPDSCDSCPFYGGKPSDVPTNRTKDCGNCRYIEGCLPGSTKMDERAKEHMKEVKERISPFEGEIVSGPNFDTGEMRILRRSLDDVYEHNKENGDVLQWLANFSPDKSLANWKYEGWANPREYTPDHPRYNPSIPDNRKHPEVEYFLYYSVEINGKTFWANVKMHKYFKGEVLYTIESERPTDLTSGPYK